MKENKIDVLVFTSSLGAGGTERVSSSLAEWICAAGYSTHLATIWPEEYDFYRVSPAIQRWILLSARSRFYNRRIIRNIFFVLELRRHLKKNGIQIVISLGDTNNVLALLACTGLSIRVIISDRVDQKLSPPSTAWRILQKLLYGRADRQVVLSTMEKQELGKRYPNRVVEYIPNHTTAIGVQDRSLMNIGADGLGVLFVGRLVPQKRIDTLVAVINHSESIGLKLSWTIVGKGPEQYRIEGLLESLPGCRITYIRETSEVHQLMEKNEIFLQTSEYEGFSNALVEALSMGMAVVCSDYGGSLTDIMGGETENPLQVFPVGDTVTCVDCLRRLTYDLVLRREMQKRAKKRSSCYTQEEISERWLRLLRSI
jgi:glycosyltransferase involved in cell wall biosynthesis